MVPKLCFCGKPSRSDDHSHSIGSSGGDSDSSTDIYCTKACAIADSLRALTARQDVECSQEWNPLMLSKDLTSSSHYRRVKRAKVIGIPTDDQISASESSTTSTPVSDAFFASNLSVPPSTSTSVTSSVCLDMEKPLPELPQVVSVDDNPNFMPNLRRTRTKDRKHLHSRNSSLSSMTDSTRFTAHSASTRATSIFSDMTDADGPKRSYTSKMRGRGRALPNVMEERDLESPKARRRTQVKRWEAENSRRGCEVTIADHFAGFLLRNQLVVDSLEGDSPHDAEDSGSMGSEYDPFELDHLLRTPRIDDYRAYLSDASMDATPKKTKGLKISRVIKENNTKDFQKAIPQFKTSLFPPIELDSARVKSTTIKASERPRENPAVAANMGRKNNRHLFPPSPSSFPTTPSVSPLIPSPSVSPTQKGVSNDPAAKKLPTTLGPAVQGIPWTSKRYSPPTKNSTFTLHRRQQSPFKQPARSDTSLPVRSSSRNPNDRVPEHTAAAHITRLPVTPLGTIDDDDISSYFDQTVLFGLGNPLFLEPVNSEVTEFRPIQESRRLSDSSKSRHGRRQGRLITLDEFPQLSRTNSGDSDEILGYYFGDDV